MEKEIIIQMLSSSDSTNKEIALMQFKNGNVEVLDIFPKIVETYNFLLEYNKVKKTDCLFGMLDALVNLESLNLRNNDIKEIKGLDKRYPNINISY